MYKYIISILILILIILTITIYCLYSFYKIEKTTNTYNKNFYKVKNNSIQKTINNPSKSKFDIKSTYINLEKNSDRRKNIEFEAKIYNVENMKRFEAIDGYNISDMSGQKIQGIEFFNDIKGGTKGALGCTLSHLSVIKKFYDSGEEWTTVLEDDMSFLFSPYWEKSISEIIKEIPEDAEFLYLSFTYNGKFDNKKKNILPVNTEDLIMGTGSYLINRKGAKKIIDNFFDGDKIMLRKKIIKEINIDTYLLKLLKRYKLKYLYFPNVNPSIEFSTISKMENHDYVKDNNIKTIEYYLKKLKEIEEIEEK